MNDHDHTNDDTSNQGASVDNTAEVPPGADAGRIIELDIDVPGTPEQVWQAIATGPGISSWYTTHRVEGREGGAVEASFGPGMDASGRVVVWDPPHRFMTDSGDSVGLAFEWLVEARDGGSCLVRLVNSGFGSGDEWDAQYDGMREGWVIFLTNLRLHLEHFAGRAATPSLPTAIWDGPRGAAWDRLLGDLGLPARPAVGERIAVAAADAPTLAGTIAVAAQNHLALVVEEPAGGTAFLAAEQSGDSISVSVWSYLYGADGAVAVERDEPGWRNWLGQRAAPETASMD